MDFNQHFCEKNQIAQGFLPVAMNTGANAGDWVSMKEFGRMAIVIFKAIGTAGDDPTITVKQAQDVSGTSPKALGFTEVRKKQAATNPVLYPSGAPTADALVRGEVSIAPVLHNATYPKQKDGAPIKIFFPPEGAPVNPYATGIPKTAAHPNAAKLFLNWNLSLEGQTFMIKELGNLTSLKVAPVYPEGFDPKVVKVWFPKFDEYVSLHAAWVEEWNKTYNYRQ